MRLRKLGTVVQVGLRLREDLRRKLATAAEDHHRSFNEELTKRLEDSLENEARQTLQDDAQSIAQDALRLRGLTDMAVERMGTWPGLLASQKKEGDNK